MGKCKLPWDVICQNACGLPACLEINGGVVDDPAIFDPYASGFPWDKAVWEYSGGALKCTIQPERYLFSERVV